MRNSQDCKTGDGCEVGFRSKVRIYKKGSFYVKNLDVEKKRKASFDEEFDEEV